MDLRSKVVLVTGGSRGIGAAVVRLAAAAGAEVIVVSRKIEACQELAEQVSREHGTRVRAHACHVGRWDELDRLGEEVGHVDVLVNNAGGAPGYDTLLDVSARMWDSVLGLNLVGPARLASLLGARMKVAGGGAIVNVSTIGAVQPRPDFAPYAAAKAGLNAMTRALALDLAPAVRVNAVMPGAIDTDLLASYDGPAREQLVAGIPLLRVGTPAEIARVVLFLAGDAAYVTGQVLAVDGGMSLYSSL